MQVRKAAFIISYSYMCLHDDFQGLGDKENMYGVGSVLPYKLCEWVVQSYAYIHKKVICKRIFI